jgi:hypothetical protein
MKQSRREPRPDFSLHSRFAIQNALAPLPHGCLDQFLQPRVSARRRDFR